MTATFSRTGNATTVRTPEGEFAFEGQGTPPLLSHLAWIRREVRRLERRAAALEALLDGKAVEDPALKH